MKPLHEWGDKELLELTPPQIQMLIDRECAEQGVALVPPLPQPLEAPTGGPTVEAFRVRVDVLIFDQEAAEELVDTINQLPMLESYYLKGVYQYGSPEGVRPTETRASFDRIRFWETENYQQHKLSQDTYFEAKKVYDKEKAEYNKAATAHGSVSEQVWDRINRAQEDYRTEEQIKETFAQYVKLADGDHDMALAFLLKATKWDEDLVYEVLDMRPEPENVEEINGDEQETDSSQDGS